MSTSQDPWLQICPESCLHTDSTHPNPLGDDVRMTRRPSPAASPWPREQFVAWMDRLKRRYGIDSDNQLAQRWGIGHTLISSWRSGTQQPSLAKLTQIAGVEEQDPRVLWVLAGRADARDVGLGHDPVSRPPAELPEQLAALVDDLVDLHQDPRISAAQQEALVRSVSIVVAGIRSEIFRTEASATRPSARRVSP